jgi:hypothetical protein
VIGNGLDSFHGIGIFIAHRGGASEPASRAGRNKRGGRAV